MRSIVLVSGPPGAGKSTIAAPLARALGFPLLAKDTIKESLHESLGSIDSDPLKSSRRLGAAAMEMLWTLAGHCSSAVLEANFRPHLAKEQASLLRGETRFVEVFCRCDLSEAARRYALRAATQRHAVHVVTSLSVDDLAEFDEPVGLGSLITVDSETRVDIVDLVAKVRSALNGGERDR